MIEICVGTLGTSSICETLIKAFQKAEIKVGACYSRSIAKAKELSAKYGIAKAYDDYDALLNDEEVNTVYIALPNSLHFPYAKRALLKNKHVILEKPFVLKYSEAEELRDIAYKQKRYLFEAVTSIHQNNIKKLKNMIQEIAPIHLAEFSYSKISRNYEKFKEGEMPNNFNYEMGGGALYDLGVYNIHMAYYLFGMPDKMSYMQNTIRGCDCSGVATLKYKDGLVVSCLAGKDVFASNGIVLMGERGYIKTIDVPSKPTRFIIEKKDFHKESPAELSNPYVTMLKVFKEIMESEDYKHHQDLLEHSLEVMKIMTYLDDNRKC